MILVTGATGLLGSELIRQLSTVYPDEQIVGLYNSSLPEINFQNVKWQQCDLLDVVSLEEIIKDATYIYHCAAIVSFNPKDKNAIIHQNVNATANVVNLALQYQVKQLAFVSLIAAIGRDEVKAGELINENHLWQDNKDISAYGKSKYYAEMEVWRGIAEGLNAVIVNPGIILGKGDWNKSSNTLFKTVYNGLNWFTDGVTAWVDAKDVAKAMIQLMQNNVVNERFILSAGNYSYQEIFNQMATDFQVKQPAKFAPKYLSEILWRYYALKQYLFGKQAVITKDTARTAYEKYYFDNQKLKQFLPDFEYAKIQDTIKEAAHYYVEKEKNFVK